MFLYENKRYSCSILVKLEISRQIFENSQISDFIKILPVTAEVSHADGQTHVTKLTPFFEALQTRLNFTTERDLRITRVLLS